MRPEIADIVRAARVKDALEDLLRDMAGEGDLDLTEPQREIAGNWIPVYRKYVHGAVPS